jgi:RNA polymerase sigma-70 factor, ECF subfamily
MEHDDLAQQSFIELVLSLDRYRGECSLETWSSTITARTVFKFLRRRTTERRIFQPSDQTPDTVTAPSSFGRQVVARDLTMRIRGHLEAIAADKAEAFLLHDVCGFSAREIAGINNISEAAAHARIARGRTELHARLAADPELREALSGLADEP